MSPHCGAVGVIKSSFDFDDAYEDTASLATKQSSDSSSSARSIDQLKKKASIWQFSTKASE